MGSATNKNSSPQPLPKLGSPVGNEKEFHNFESKLLQCNSIPCVWGGLKENFPALYNVPAYFQASPSFPFCGHVMCTQKSTPNTTVQQDELSQTVHLRTTVAQNKITTSTPYTPSPPLQHHSTKDNCNAQSRLHAFICLFYNFDNILKKVFVLGSSLLVCFHISQAFKGKQLRGFLLYHEVLSLQFSFLMSSWGLGVCVPSACQG